MAFPSGFAGYDLITPSNPSSSLTDFFYVLNANLLSSTWWANVKSDGGDVQAYKADGTRLPVYLHNWSYGSQAGNIYVGYPGTKLTTSEAIRIYTGNPSESQPAAGASFGQHAVFPSPVRAFYPDGGGDDATQYASHLTMTGSPTVGGVAGPISGSLATDYDGVDDYGEIASPPTFATTVPFTYGASLLSRNPSCPFWGRTDGVTGATETTSYTQGRVRLIGGGALLFDIPNNSNAWANLVGTKDTANDVRFYSQGGESSTGALAGGTQTMSANALGRRSTFFTDGKIAFAYVYAAQLSADHIAYWHAMLDPADPSQAGFYSLGGWTPEGSSRLMMTNNAYFRNN